MGAQDSSSHFKRPSDMNQDIERCEINHSEVPLLSSQFVDGVDDCTGQDRWSNGLIASADCMLTALAMSYGIGIIGTTYLASRAGIHISDMAFGLIVVGTFALFFGLLHMFLPRTQIIMISYISCYIVVIIASIALVCVYIFTFLAA